MMSCGVEEVSSGFCFGGGYSSPAESGIMEDLGLSSTEYSVFASIMTVGGMLGAVVSGNIADLIGRRGAMWFSDIFVPMGWLAILLAKGAWSLDLGRLSLGFGLGILQYAAVVYIAEITPKNSRGGFTAANSMMICGGVSFMFFIGYIFTCCTLAIFGMIPCLVQFLGLFFIPESPRWLIGVGLMSLQQFGGTNAILYYASSIFEAAGCSASVGMTAMAIIQIPFTALCVFLMDKSGRRPLLMVCAAGTCLGNILVGLAFLLKDLHQSMELSAALVLSGILVYSVSFSLGVNGTPWVLMAEIFPINVRGSAGSLVTFANWFSSWIVSYSFDFLFEWSSTGIFFIFATIFGSLVLFVAKLVPETKGRSLEEIQASMTHLSQ